ncbi:HYExAFE family protein [Planctomycetota bacterium]|nr:HYExAFE family protein [Planctomycetota bacterium]
MQRRFHYELAFEHFLRENKIPHISVDEAKRSLIGKKGSPKVNLKSFDFVVYSECGPNLLIDVKGRKHAANTGRSLQNWVTEDDIKGLTQWSHIFGENFIPVFAFLFWCDTQPPDALFMETFEFRERWYAMSAVKLEDYVKHMKTRSASWGTVSIPTADFDRIHIPLYELLGSYNQT